MLTSIRKKIGYKSLDRQIGHSSRVRASKAFDEIKKINLVGEGDLETFEKVKKQLNPLLSLSKKKVQWVWYFPQKEEIAF